MNDRAFGEEVVYIDSFSSAELSILVLEVSRSDKPLFECVCYVTQTVADVICQFHDIREEVALPQRMPRPLTDTFIEGDLASENPDLLPKRLISVHSCPVWVFHCGEQCRVG